MLANIDYYLGIPQMNPGTGPVGVPNNPHEAISYGYLLGLENGMALCGVFNYFERWRMQSKINKMKAEWNKTFATQIEAGMEGGVGAVEQLPTIGERSSRARTKLVSR